MALLDDLNQLKSEADPLVAELRAATSVSDLVKSLNALGVQPKDLTAIFQTLRETGALQADLEIL